MRVAMKWRNRTAQIFRPGNVERGIRPDKAAEMRDFRSKSFVLLGSSDTVLRPNDPVALAGRNFVGAFPGLKAWTVLSMAKVAHPRLGIT
jgi:hypothetical protein